jgi:hypothetical protein
MSFSFWPNGFNDKICPPAELMRNMPSAKIVIIADHEKKNTRTSIFKM